MRPLLENLALFLEASCQPSVSTYVSQRMPTHRILVAQQAPDEVARNERHILFTRLPSNLTLI